MQISGRCRGEAPHGADRPYRFPLILARERCRVKSGVLWSPPMAGLFITFEGLDGSGKSTHLKRAAEWLEAGGVACQVTHEPGGTPLGDALRGIFLDPRWGRVDGMVEL